MESLLCDAGYLFHQQLRLRRLQSRRRNPLYSPWTGLLKIACPWPEFQILCGRVDDPDIPANDVFAEMPFMHVTQDVCTRDGTDPVLRALQAVEATEVPLDDFRMCNLQLEMELPLLGSGYWVWGIKRRRVCARTHEWQVALRVGGPSRRRTHE